jgi:hypothetical protein
MTEQAFVEHWIIRLLCILGICYLGNCLIRLFRRILIFVQTSFGRKKSGNSRAELGKLRPGHGKEEVSADRAVTSRTSFLDRVFVPVDLVTAENLLDLVDHSGHLDSLKK